MFRGTNLFTLSCLIFLILGTSLLSAVTNADNRLIVDLSWPNCGAKLANLTSSAVVGVNDGLDYSVNPCLSSETQLFHNSYSLYLNTGYPGASYGLKYAHYPKPCKSSDYICLAYNYGYNDGLYSIKQASDQDAHSFVWWLDVETDNSWANSYVQNRVALVGMIDALDSQLFMQTIGFYSSPNQWQLITNSWRNKDPDWLPSASSTEITAIKYCSTSITGGQTWLTQYTPYLDYNYSCLPSLINNFKIR